MLKQVVLLILDGWGISDIKKFNAIHAGKTPVLDRLNQKHPYIPIQASGEHVGLPPGQMGNSEVGHLNIGAGRVVYQDLLRISRAIEDGSFFSNEALLTTVTRAKLNDKALHLMGLVSDGGVHSHIDHIPAFLELAKRNGLSKVYIHALMDGRDTPPDSGIGHIQRLNAMTQKAGVGKIATVQGRFHAMDRDKRWDRVERGYNLLVNGEGAKHASAVEAIEAGYAKNVMDEFIEPSVIIDNINQPVGMLSDGDEMLMFNYRADRMRQIVRALYDPAFAEFTRPNFPKVGVTCLTEYDANFHLPVAYETVVPKHGLGETLAKHGLTQLRIAETEKYAHVTFFFNGGVEKANENENRKLTPSPRVRTYDLQPEMSCPQVTDNLAKAIEEKKYDLIVANLANGDMVGHTGIWAAALEAVSVIDTAVGRIVKACEKAGARLIITADHGNIDCMVDENGKPHTQHTVNPVPLYYIGDDTLKLKKGGKLADIAPTILSLLGLEKPEEMTGESLLG